MYFWIQVNHRKKEKFLRSPFELRSNLIDQTTECLKISGSDLTLAKVFFNFLVDGFAVCAVPVASIFFDYIRALGINGVIWKYIPYFDLIADSGQHFQYHICDEKHRSLCPSSIRFDGLPRHYEVLQSTPS